jgi:tRNA (cytidine/uridine-2'-O-)-methyltransferase
MAKTNLTITKNHDRLKVVLIQPDIPQNTGNIARLCFATDCELVLVRPLGFRLTDKNLKRAGMDYWQSLNPLILDDIEDFKNWQQNRNVYYLSAHAQENYAQTKFKPGDVLVFGSESSGLPDDIYQDEQLEKKLIGLPMIPDARCINVSSAAAAVVYEALRQVHNWSSDSEVSENSSAAI